MNKRPKNATNNLQNVFFYTENADVQTYYYYYLLAKNSKLVYLFNSLKKTKVTCGPISILIIFYHYMGTFGPILIFLKLFRAIWSHLNPYGAIQIHLEQFGAIWIHLDPFEAV